MKPVIFYDTETTGLPEWQVPSDHESQPHLVQVGAIVCDIETGKVINTLDVIIKPDGWVIPDEVAAIHGITTEYALQVGISEEQAIKTLIEMTGDFERCAYNKTFDQRIIRIGLKRYFSEAEQEKWGDKDNHHCAMRMAQKAMGGKNPKLVDAYKFFTGEELEDAHTAMADAKACMDVYLAINK
jgi:DNA polymerase-3 subunit epsilon